MIELVGNELMGARQGVVEKGGRDELAGAIVEGLLPERLPEAVGNAAVDLARDDHRVDLIAAVVDRDITNHLEFSGLAIDLDNRDVSAEGIGEIGRIVEAGFLESGFDVLRQVVGEVGAEHHVSPVL